MAKQNTVPAAGAGAFAAQEIPEHLKTAAAAAGIPSGLLQQLWAQFGPIVVQILISVISRLVPQPSPVPPLQVAGPLTGSGDCDHAACCHAEMEHLAAAIAICAHQCCCCDQEQES